METENPNVGTQELLPPVSGKIGRRAYETGDCSKGLLSMGRSVIFAGDIKPLADIVSQLEDEAQVALRRLDQQRIEQPEFA